MKLYKNYYYKDKVTGETYKIAEFGMMQHPDIGMLIDSVICWDETGNVYIYTEKAFINKFEYEGKE